MKHALALLLAAFSLIVVGQVPDYVPNDGLVGWWPLDGNGENAVTDGLDFELTNVIGSNGYDGGPGAAISFNGESSMGQIHENVGLAGEFSLSIWIRSDLGIVNYNPLFHIGDAQTCENEASQLEAYVGNGGLTVVTNRTSPQSSDHYFNAFSYNTWTHLGLRLSDGVMTMFLDGEPFETWPFEALNEASFDSFLGFGQWLDSQCVTSYYEGEMDNLGLWNRALSDLEMAVVQAAGSLGCTDLTACNYDAAAAADDGSCLFLPEASLASLVQLSNSSELEVVVPPGLSSWHWTDGDSNAVRTIQPLQTYVLEGTVGNLPQLGDELEGGLVFAIDTLAETAYIATSEAIGSGSEWGCKFTTTGATASDFGAGWSNTELILNACGEENCAARVASALGTGWHLPSRDELEAIRTTLFDTDLAFYFTDNTYNWYWSSTECSSNSTAATSIHFLDGFVAACNNKDSNPGGVIAINKIERSFCAYADTLRIEIQGEPLCGEGTIWDESTEECVVANPADTNLDGCVQLNDLLDVLSAYGDCGAEEAPWACGDPLSYQGYDYATVQIGDQCWFAENLRSEAYSNGDTVLANLSDEAWSTTSLGAAAVWGQGSAFCTGENCDISPSDAVDAFGRLYNWYAIADERGLCPYQWKVPTDSDWGSLELQIGLDSSLLLSPGWRGNVGAILKSDEGWNGSNLVGLNLLPTGDRAQNGRFNDNGTQTHFWTTSEDGVLIRRSLVSWYEGIERDNDARARRGMPVRCLQSVE